MIHLENAGIANKNSPQQSSTSTDIPNVKTDLRALARSVVVKKMTKHLENAKRENQTALLRKDVNAPVDTTIRTLKKIERCHEYRQQKLVKTQKKQQKYACESAEAALD